MGEHLSIVRNGVEVSTAYPFTDFGEALDTLLREREFWLHYRHFGDTSHHARLCRGYRTSIGKAGIQHWQQLTKPTGQISIEGEASIDGRDTMSVNPEEFKPDEIVYIGDGTGKGYWHVPTGVLLERFKNPRAQGIDINLRESLTGKEPPHASLGIRILRSHDDRLSVDLVGNAFNPEAKDFLCTTLGMTPDNSLTGVLDPSDYSSPRHFKKEYPSETWATRREATTEVMKIVQDLLQYEG